MNKTEFLNTLKSALRKIPELTKEQITDVINRFNYFEPALQNIKKDSTFFNLDKKVKLSSNLLNITRKQFLKICTENLQLFYQNPQTLFDTADATAKLLGIDRDEYIKKACLKRGSLLYQKPKEIYNNFKNIKKLLKLDHETLIKKCYQHPALLTSEIKTINHKIKENVRLLKITRADFIKIATKGVQLLYQDPETINSNAETASKLLGIEKETYIKAAISKPAPALLYQDPNTIYNNAIETAKLLGVELKDFVELALKSPSLFSNDPVTICNHGDIIKEILNRIKQGKEEQNIKKKETATVLSSKQALSFSNENLLLRYIYSCVVLSHGKKVSYSKLMTRSKDYINETLDYYLDKDNKLEKRLKTFDFDDIIELNNVSKNVADIYKDIQNQKRKNYIQIKEK